MEAPERPGQVWVSNRVTVGRSPIHDDGLFATDDVAAGTVLIRLAGRLVSSAELAALLQAVGAGGDTDYVDTITVYEDRHLVLPPGTLVHFGNHNCDPNLWHAGPYEIAARSDVQAGQELTIDYGTNSAAAGFSMSCCCRSAQCRGQVSSEDWRRPELQARYRGHWVPALAERMATSSAVLEQDPVAPLE